MDNKQTLHKIQAFPTNFLVRKFSVNEQLMQIFEQIARNLWKLSIYRKFPHRETRWKSLYFMRRNHFKEEIKFEQNNLEIIVFLKIKSEMIPELV